MNEGLGSQDPSNSEETIEEILVYSYKVMRGKLDLNEY